MNGHQRYQRVGLKQTIRVEWLQKAVDLWLAGRDAQCIRRELHEFLAEHQGKGSAGPRSDQTRAFVVTNLMRVWITPDTELLSFRDTALTLLQEQPSMRLAIHWAMISAAYPFWFNVARQTGRLLNLQDRVTYQQILRRIKEHYGDRTTITRETQRVIRAFVAWGVLADSDGKGCYAKHTPLAITEARVTALMLEAALLTSPGDQAALAVLIKDPALFPFELPILTGAAIGQATDRLGVDRYSLDDELLVLKAP
ncbi:MAG: hypothetical protein JXM75_10475 [Chromatiaceae bacterium]|nr:hypothetical protein [Chromatiaceae bacterium]